jgi:hypothetical protein
MTTDPPSDLPGETPPQSQQPTPPQSPQPSTPPAQQPSTPPPPGMPVEHDDAAVLEGAGDFTSGEGLVAFAGMVVIAVWVIFAIILNEYFINWLMLVLAVAAAVLPRVDRDQVEKLHPLPVLLKVAGYGIALIALVELISDIRYGVLDNVADILAGLITYVAGLMAFVGARQIKI